jgi:twinkle protein
VSDAFDRDDAKRLAQVSENSDALTSVSALDLKPLIERLWDDGLPPGSRTGWPSLDRHYTVVPGQLTIVTGWPGSGKSEWLDAMLLNLARGGWRFALFSPENKPEEVHAVKFLEKFTGKPFGPGPTPRMSKDEAVEAATEIEDWFGFFKASANHKRETFPPDMVIDAAELYFRLRGWWRSKEVKRGLVIDPWNEMEHLRPQFYSETEYISATLSMIRAWARDNAVHVWIVAHPQKLRRMDDGKLPVPTPDTISGSQHWWNKADNCVTVWREFGDNPSQTVEIHVQKVRFKHVGRQGIVPLLYDRVTGRYHEAPQGLRSVGGRDD